MKHSSVPTGAPIELINVTPLNPLISKCQIKVCYVGDTPNRNGSIITKNTALDLANTLPGSPIVGYYQQKTEDFEEHNKTIKTATWEIYDETKPYGFVDLNAKVWFQKFFDDGVEHEYLVTEGYLWTGQYPEAQRIIEKGNNQSMELDDNSLKGFWATDDNWDTMFFIINEAIISKLCILGEDFEPCFEGAAIAKEFSLDESFNQKIFKLMQEVKKLKGEDTPMNDLVENETLDEVLNPEEEQQEVVTEFAAQEPEEEAVEEQAEAEPAEEEPEVEQPAEEPAEEVEEAVEEEAAEEEEPESEENSQDEVAQFSLNDFQELTEKYSTLEDQFNTLQESYNSLQEQFTALSEENNGLKEFKHQVETQKKQTLIDSFYMLSDKDKEDVVNHIDEYSYEDIEAKLSIICVRNKLDLSGTKNTIKDTTYNLEHEDEEDSNIPGWIKALRETKNNDR